jgi:hypothetical protein
MVSDFEGLFHRCVVIGFITPGGLYSRVKLTLTSPIGSMAWVMYSSSASIMIGGVIEPVMMTSPADNFSP